LIRIANAEEFQRLVEALAYDVGTANIHWRLYRDLHAALGQDRVVWHQSQTFWYLTLNAHTYAALQSLSRAYDQNPSALHLLSWLKTIEANLHLFEIAEFRKRLAGNAFVDSLAAHSRIPDRAQLDEDIAKCSVSDPRVKALVQHRGNIGAHRNARTTAAGRPASEEFAISVEDLEVLLDRAHEIVNRYSSLFEANTYSRQMIGHDDYRYIIASVKEAAERYDASSGG
jgi:hypothetical protein